MRTDLASHLRDLTIHTIIFQTKVKGGIYFHSISEVYVDHQTNRYVIDSFISNCAIIWSGDLRPFLRYQNKMRGVWDPLQRKGGVIKNMRERGKN